MQNQDAAAGQPSHVTTGSTPALSGTIRPVVPADLPALLTLIEAGGVFAPEELAEMHTLLSSYFLSSAAAELPFQRGRQVRQGQ